MEDGVFPSNIAMSGTLSDTTSGGFDFMDELFLSGGWFDSANGSDFLQPGPSGSPALFDSVYSFPSSDLSNGKSNENPNNQEERERLICRENPPLIEPETLSLKQNTIEIAECSTQQESHLAEGCLELSTRGWIELRENPVPVTSVRERLMQALQYIKESTKDREILIQMWVPIERGGKHVLTTNDQPFSLDPNCQRLANYRNVSMNYQFAAEEHSKESTGLPSRVYLGKVPEWTPDVQLFSSDEYPRIVYAQHYDVRGTFALPVFEPGSRTCLGVIEVVMTTQKMSYLPDLEIICKALEAVDLRSSEISSSPNVKVCNESYQKALPEILEVLRAVCMTHRLPLAQTWVPCIQQGKQGCRHSDENYAYCVSTVDSACYVTDPQIWGFHEACSEHHLLRGQGLVGRAFMTNQPCFSTNITTLSKIGYPLSHHARIFGLRAAVAIRLRSIYTGMADYVLELFLPVDCQETEEQKMMLNSLSIIIQRVCRSLRVVTDKELEEETIPQISEVVALSHRRHNTEEIPKFVSSPPEGSSLEESSWSVDITTTQQKGKSVQMEFRKEQPTEEFKITTHWDNPKLVLHQGQTVSEHKQHHQDSRPKNSIECGRGSSSIGGSRFPSAGKTGEKRRTKTERTISLQVLRQHFAGSLKDAAKSIGVCPTTLKRICRQHGITRWPSRKIKKVGHSLRKLQVVIDSVHGAEGTFQIESFYANFQDLTSPSLSGTNQLSKLNATDHPNLVNMQTEGTISPETALSKSSSSSQSQSSSSSLCCSSRAQQPPHAANIAGSKDASVAENPVGVLKRAHSDAELHALSEQAPRLLGKSHSHKSLHENPSLESLPPLPKSRSSVSRNRGGLKVKVTFGEEKIRFSMQHNWGFKDLQQEIARRFSIDDVSGIDLKYLDDDSEWVLLTCDADLEECMDIYKSFQIHTMKLSVYQISQPNLRSSMGSSGPS